MKKYSFYYEYESAKDENVDNSCNNKHLHNMPSNTSRHELTIY